MTWQYPLGFALMGAVPIILWLHRLRRRVPERGVPSLVPWLVLRVAEPMRRRRVPPSVLLALHVLGAVLLALAAAGPLRHGAAAPSGDVALVIDTTLSMRAGDRWPAARAAAADVLASAVGRVTVVELGPRPTVRVARTLDRAVASAAVERLAPGGVGGDVAGALALAAAAAGEGARIEVITDGALARGGGGLPSAPGTAAPPAGDVPVRWRIVGQVAGRDSRSGSANESDGASGSGSDYGSDSASGSGIGSDDSMPNVAVVGIAAADDASGGVRVVAQIASYGSDRTRARVSLAVGGRAVDDAILDLTPNGVTAAAWRVAGGGGAAEVRAVRLGEDDAAVGDALPLDDSAFVPLAAAEAHVQFVARSAAVRRALDAQPRVRLTEVGLGTLADDGLVDVTVVEGVSTVDLPMGGALVIDPRGGSWLEEAAEAITGTWQAGAPHPITAGLDLAGVRLAGLRATGTPAWASVLAHVDGRPALWAGTRDGHRIVVLGFDPAGGTLAERDAFPQLIGRALGWAAPAMPPPSLPAGAVFDLPPWPVAITAPDGRRTLAALRFDDTITPGLYTIRRRRVPRAGVTEPGVTVAVRAGDPDESRLAPLSADALAAAFAPGITAASGGSGTAGARALQGRPAQPIQRWPLAAALGVLLVEAAWRAAPARRPTARAAGRS